MSIAKPKIISNNMVRIHENRIQVEYADDLHIAVDAV